MSISKTVCFCLAALNALISAPSTARAGAPALKVELAFGGGTTTYGPGEPIAVGISVANQSGQVLYIGSGMSARSLAQHIRLIDPAGRLLLPKRPPHPVESPDAPPLPFADLQGVPMRMGACEPFAVHQVLTKPVADLREIYPMDLPGVYSAQVQLSAMVFRSGTCNLANAGWVGVLKSPVHYFYMPGRARFEVVPDRWHLAWELSPGPIGVKVVVPYAPGRSKREYGQRHFWLNDLRTTRIERKTSGLEAYFDGRECLKHIGPPATGREYLLAAFGLLTNGVLYGGECRIFLTD